MKIQTPFLRCVLTCVAATLLVVTSAFAQPTLTVVDGGSNGGNREFLVRVAPDASLLPAGGGSLALELGFNVTSGSLVSASANSSLWPFLNPGNDPFTGGVSNGVNVNTAANTVFAALGSDLFTSGAPVDVMTISVVDTGTMTLTWGGHTLLGGTANQFTGSRIAQNAVNYDNYMGSLTLTASGLGCDLHPVGSPDGDCDHDDIDVLYTMNPSSADILTWLNNPITGSASDPTNPYKLTTTGGTTVDVYVVGDVNLNGDVDSTDLGLLLNNFAINTNVGWGGGDLDADTMVDSTDLGLLLNNFSFTSAASAAAVPEPSSLGLLLIAACGLMARRRR